ncbi:MULTISPECIES: hypothetical protein [Streptomycetaceae]|uniref:hypothetical protein n=1 Tax=Streptomycetaceae TaxID=2062 RepID=UPI000B141395|nr:hypothetical protein [Streptantibioticus cattleyicolor]
MGTRLHWLAAQVAYLTGWMAYDAGLKSAGQQHYVAALRSAQASGDDDLGAFVLAEMGVHISETGQDGERVTLVETALSKGPAKLPSSTCSFLHLHRAVALSRQGDHRRAAAALHLSETSWDRSNGHRSDWLSWYGEGQIASSRGKVLLRSGQVDKATRALADSIEKAVPRDQAVRSGRLAQARLEGKDLHGALDAANRGLALLEERVSSARAVECLAAFSSKLGSYKKVPAVREFRDRLKALPEVAAA